LSSGWREGKSRWRRAQLRQAQVPLAGSRATCSLGESSERIGSTTRIACAQGFVALAGGPLVVVGEVGRFGRPIGPVEDIELDVVVRVDETGIEDAVGLDDGCCRAGGIALTRRGDTPDLVPTTRTSPSRTVSEVPMVPMVPSRTSPALSCRTMTGAALGALGVQAPRRQVRLTPHVVPSMDVPPVHAQAVEKVSPLVHGCPSSQAAPAVKPPFDVPGVRSHTAMRWLPS
jgi:hypothetical protein